MIYEKYVCILYQIRHQVGLAGCQPHQPTEQCPSRTLYMQLRKFVYKKYENMGCIIYNIRPGLINPSWTSTHKYANKTNTSINIALAQRTLDLSTFTDTQQLINQSGGLTFIIISLSASVNVVKRIYFRSSLHGRCQIVLGVKLSHNHISFQDNLTPRTI